MISDFEQYLPFRRIDIDDFERRVKKLTEHSSGHYLSILQIEKCFEDHQAFEEIISEKGIIRNIFKHNVFKKDGH